MGHMLKSTPPLGMKDEAGAGLGDQGFMASTSPPPVTKASPFSRQGEETYR